MHYLAALESALAENPIAALLGPRQCGKTTLARQFAEDREPTRTFDLETAAGRARLGERAWVAYPGETAYPLSPRVDALPVRLVPGTFCALA
jgi:predicted AAA+ superfamily ATPase